MASSSQHEFKPISQGQVVAEDEKLSRFHGTSVSDSLVAFVSGVSHFLNPGNRIVIWDIDRHEKSQVIEHKNVSLLKADPKQKRLISASADKIAVHQLNEGKNLFETVGTFKLPENFFKKAITAIEEIDLLPDNLHFIGVFQAPNETGHTMTHHVFILNKLNGNIQFLEWYSKNFQIISVDNIFKLFFNGIATCEIYVVDVNTANEKMFGKPIMLKEGILISLRHILPKTMTLIMEDLSRTNVTNIIPIKADFTLAEKEVVQLPYRSTTMAPMRVFSDGSLLMFDESNIMKRVPDVRKKFTEPMTCPIANIRFCCVMGDQRIVVFDNELNYSIFPKPIRIALYEKFCEAFNENAAIDEEIFKNIPVFSRDVCGVVSSYTYEYEPTLFKQRKSLLHDLSIQPQRSMLIKHLEILISALETDDHPDNALLMLLHNNLVKETSKSVDKILSMPLNANGCIPSEALQEMLGETQKMFKPTLVNRPQ